MSTRTMEWSEPLASATAAAGLSGLEAMQAIASGTIPAPPIAVLMDMALEEVAEGRAVFAVTPQEFHYNPIGTVHGGIAATLLDSAMGCAVHTTCPAGVGYTTLELSVNYVRPFTIDSGRVRATGTVVHRGRRVATAEGRLETIDGGRLLAHGTTTCIILES